MSRPWPPSLLGRNLLVLLTLILAGQLMAGVIFRHYVQRPRADAYVTVLTQHLGALGAGIAALPPEHRRAFVAAFNQNSASHGLSREKSAIAAPFERLLLRRVSARLAEAGVPVTWRQEAGRALDVRLEVAGQGYWLTTAGLDLPLALPRAALLIWLLTVSLSVAGAFLLTRRLYRPLAHLADAATQLGQGADAPPLAETGPSEIATVSRAFNAMRVELQRKEQERAFMLAGISHDLRTPLAKIRLAIELLPEDQNPDLVASLLASTRQMTSLVDRFIDYARDDAEERPGPVLLPTFLGEILAGIAGGEAFSQDLAPTPTLTLRRAALGRLVANLVENALRYGQPPYVLRSRTTADHLTIEVVDGGTGIPPEALEALRRPFARGDSARGGAQGAGLGLAIAERIARAEGGQLAFLHPAKGGFLVRLSLPLAEPASNPPRA
ncbi:MAG: ATP-binding protein [Rhodocyclaceae bacterium]|jgi:two-component system osmolarity sensor histidine kinase EnvZ|nr:ATP-binding protein [Rhodocyclaceae bacterium]